LASRSESAAGANIALPFSGFRVIDVHERGFPRAQGDRDMTTFTITAENNITAHPTQDHAAVAAGAQVFNSLDQLAEVAAAWPAERLIEIWNSLAGVTPVKRFTDRKTAIRRIWDRIQRLGDATQPSAEPEKPKAAMKAKGRAQAAHVAPAKGKGANPAKNAPKGKKAAQKTELAGPRKGTKMAQVITLLQRKNGATLVEISESMGWQRHTVRGFMAGAMKKAGYTIESFKPEGGGRTYRLPAK
jgi:Protein of unknown function (DUF3489)